jgi:antitoxin component YwqK of YwqJK toxin-antitoxin module
MKMKVYSVLGALSVLLGGCQKNKKEDEVISERYIHKYGYAISKEEWNSKNYPGQVITHLRTGVTVTATYENGLLHGPCTHTYPHSQTVESYYLYNQGNLVKEILYDIKGMPTRERVQLSSSRFALTYWYANGCPMCTEEYINEELLEGQYFTVQNEIEARVEKGSGRRIRRDQKGTLIAIEEVEQGYVTKQEAFFPNGAPESISYFLKGKLHGERKLFTQTGEPIAVEEWIDGKLHGKSTYYKNGVKVLEVSYLGGQKEGLETHFADGKTISQQIKWENNIKHGPSIFYINNIAQTEYFYNGEKVSKETYEERLAFDEVISQIADEVRVSNQ